MAKKKRKQPPKKVGRKSKLDKIDLGIVQRLAAQGLTDEQMSKILDVSVPAFNRYKKNPEFRKSLKEGKSDPDRRVEAALFNKAVGFKYTDTVVQKIKIARYKEKIVTIEVDKVHPPDTLAIIYWLNNRKPDDWKQRQEVGHTVKGKITLVNQVPTHSNKKKK